MILPESLNPVCIVASDGFGLFILLFLGFLCGFLLSGALEAMLSTKQDKKSKKK